MLMYWQKTREETAHIILPLKFNSFRFSLTLKGVEPLMDGKCFIIMWMASIEKFPTFIFYVTDTPIDANTPLFDIKMLDIRFLYEKGCCYKTADLWTHTHQNEFNLLNFHFQRKTNIIQSMIKKLNFDYFRLLKIMIWHIC